MTKKKTGMVVQNFEDSAKKNEFRDHIKECLPPLGSKQAQIMELPSWDIERS